MKVFANARVIVCEEQNATDEQGTAFNWFTVYLKDETGSVLKINSGKNNFSDFEGENGIVEIDLFEDQNTKKLKAKAVAFTANKSFELPEGEIH